MPDSIRFPLVVLALALMPLLTLVAPATACDDERSRCWSDAVRLRAAADVDVISCEAEYAACTGRRLIHY